MLALSSGSGIGLLTLLWLAPYWVSTVSWSLIHWLK